MSSLFAEFLLIYLKFLEKWERRSENLPLGGDFTPSKRSTGRRPLEARREFRALRSAT